MKITKNSTLAEILSIKEADRILAKHNLPCVSCPFAKDEMEKLEIGKVCEMYEINLENLLKDLNEEA